MTLLAANRSHLRHSSEVTILGLGTASPFRVAQTLAAELSEPLCCDDAKQTDFLKRIYLRSGVDYRGSVVAAHGLQAPSETTPGHQQITQAVRCFYPLRKTPTDRGPTTGQRMQIYAREAPRYAERSARAALDSGQIEPAQITHLITASCTGFFAPGLDVELIQRLGLPHSVQRQHLGFMGCHAAFNAMAAGRTIVRADPRAHVLISCTELCSLHLAYGFEPQKIVANALFADGSAAVIMSGSGPQSRDPETGTKPHLRDAASLLVSDSPDAMTWTIGDHGFEMTLSAEVPSLIRQHVPQWVNSLLARHGLTLADVPHFAIHPGGPKILDAVASALAIPEESMAASREILAEQGNMSSATILFVLQRLAAKGATGPCLALGFGPGLMAEAMLLEL
jgi:prepilin-type processing-associated H-X9-DG protein